MLKNDRVTTFTVSELLRENQQGGGVNSAPPPPLLPPRLRLHKQESLDTDLKAIQ